MTRSTTDVGPLVVAAAEAFAGDAALSAGVRFRWSAGGLVVSARGGPEGLVLPPPDGPAAPAGSTELLPAAVAPMAASGALLASLVRLRPAPGGPLVAGADAPRPAPPPATPTVWLGFRRVTGGWVSLAVVEAQREVAAFGLADVRRRRLSPAQSACRLQSLGVPALPARAADALPEPVAPAPARRRDGGGPGRAGVRCPGDPGWRPLVGYRVLGLGRLVAAPHAVHLLESLGARVCRVRAPGDPGPARGGAGAEEVDLCTPAGRERLMDLAAGSDLLVENYRPRAWDQLVPGAVRGTVARHVAVRGFPGTSPCRNWKVLGFMAEAAFGLGTAPVRTAPDRVPASRVPLWDRVAGTVAAARAVDLLSGSGGDAEIALVGLARDLVPVAGRTAAIRGWAA